VEACNICFYPWRTMVILQDGSVVLCCVDFNGMQVVGDVNKNTIEEIWNGEQYRKVRDDFKRLKYEKYPTCMQCDLIKE
jgi:radical SAM protein with 4Fe4S-binding SPASM domain